MGKTAAAGCASIQPSCIQSTGSTALDKGRPWQRSIEIPRFNMSMLALKNTPYFTHTGHLAYFYAKNRLSRVPSTFMHSGSDVHSAEINHLASIFSGFSRHPAFFAPNLSFIPEGTAWLTFLANGGYPPPIRVINRVSITHAVYQYETAYFIRIHLSSMYRWFSYQ